jgi:uncharacterized protein (DUF433 family)
MIRRVKTGDREWRMPPTSATIELLSWRLSATSKNCCRHYLRGEKAQIRKWVVQELGDAFPGIDSRADVCGGEPCIVRTRIPVWLLEQSRRLGASEQDLLAAYPTLRAEDLVNAWADARSHTAQIDPRFAITRPHSGAVLFQREYCAVRGELEFSHPYSGQLDRAVLK